MPSYIQIAGDPTQWWPDEPFSASQLTGQPVSIQIMSPVMGNLVISPRAAGVAVFETNQASPGLLPIHVPGIYVPSAAGLAVGHAGYQLPASTPDFNLGTLIGQITTLMSQGSRQSITLGGTASGGTLVLNGATLSFAFVLFGDPPSVGDSVPHGR
jgi:hypothetical protein